MGKYLLPVDPCPKKLKKQLSCSFKAIVSQLYDCYQVVIKLLFFNSAYGNEGIFRLVYYLLNPKNFLKKLMIYIQFLIAFYFILF